MNRSTSYLIGIILTILIGTFLYFNLCSDCRLSSMENDGTTKETNSVKIPDPTSFPFAFNDKDYAFEVTENFNFDLSSSNITPLVSKNVDNGIESLKSYLLENSNKSIGITGLYTGDEDNSTAWPNLGLARANTIKNYFVKMGVPSAQTGTFGKQMDDLIPNGNTLLGPVTYEIYDFPEDSKDQLNMLYEKIKANPLVLYFESGASSISLTPEQRQKVADIARYLDKVDGAICAVVGHTDNTGSRETNIALGQERADFVKGYLIGNGILETKINSSSQGPNVPIAPNDTEEGRAKNRRTVITLN